MARSPRRGKPRVIRRSNNTHAATFSTTSNAPIETARALFHKILAKKRLRPEIRNWANHVLRMQWSVFSNPENLLRLMGKEWIFEKGNEKIREMIMRAFGSANLVFLRAVKEKGKNVLLVYIGPRAQRKNIIRAFETFLGRTEEQEWNQTMEKIVKKRKPVKK